MSGPIVVRDAVAGDMAGLASLNVAAWKAGYRGLLPDDFLDALTVESRGERWSWRPEPEAPILVVEAEPGVVAGYAWLRASTEPGGGGEVLSFYVHPQHWRSGLGRVLMRASLTRLRALGHDHATLWVLDGNERAIAFYRTLGWSFDGEARVDHDPGLPPLPHHRMAHPLRPWVRDATVRDAGRIAQIHVAAWRAAYRGFGPDEVLDAPDFEDRRRQWWSRVLPVLDEDVVLVAEGADGVVGFTSFGPAEGEAADVALLGMLYLDPSLRRGGLGTLLDDTARARMAAAGYREAVLWAVAGNEPAERFYFARGWRPDGAERPTTIPGAVDVFDRRWRRTV